MDRELEIAKRMQIHLKEGKSILEAEALAKMEVALESDIQKIEEVKVNEAEIYRDSKKNELLANQILLKEYFSLSDEKKEFLKKEFQTKETWRLLMLSCNDSKLEYLRRHYEEDVNDKVKPSSDDLLKKESYSNSIIYENRKDTSSNNTSLVKCNRCKSTNVELTSSEKIGIFQRAKLIFMAIGFFGLLSFFAGIFGSIIGFFLILIMIIFSLLDVRKEYIYHCKTCNHVFKTGFGN